MSITTIRRRVDALEGAASLALLSNAPPPTLADFEGIVRRLEAGDQFTDQELKRMERHGAICHGEFLPTRS